MGTYNTRSIGNTLQDVQRLVSTKTQHQSLREAADRLMDDVEMKKLVDDALSKVERSSNNNEEQVTLKEREEEAIRVLLSKLSTGDPKLNRGIRNHTKNMFGNYQGKDFGAHR